jgi:hypothetical protein
MPDRAALMTPALIAKSVALHAELAAVLGRSRTLLFLGHERRLSTTYPRLRPISGGDDPDTSLVIEALVKGGACLECLVTKSGVPAPTTAKVLQRLEAIVVITVVIARCDGCLRLARTYQIGDPTPPTEAVPARRATEDLAHALWRFLTERRGQMFCATCIATALEVTRRIDRVLFVAEGRGARRQYGLCAQCGKDRLLCGLASN